MAAHLPTQGLDRLIPIDLRPEPRDFDDKVRKRGFAWLESKGISPHGPLPAGETLPPYWRDALAQLGDAYSHICAYFAVRIDTVTSHLTTDHFVPKSKEPGRAYEWANFRLACWRANGRKLDHDDVLDPIGLQPGTSHLNLADGSIRPNPGLDAPLEERARKTITRLRLDGPELRQRRAMDYSGYLRNGGDDHAQEVLRQVSPFVWCEATRQGLL